MSSISKELNDTHGTTLVFIRTKELVVLGSDSRSSHKRSGRVVRDNKVKYEAITSTVYATGSGSEHAAKTLFDELRKQYMEKKNSGIELTLKEIADYGLKHARTMKNTSNSAYGFIGIENERPEAYVFLVNEHYMDSSDHIETWWSTGSGSQYADLILQANYNDNLSEQLTLQLAELSLLTSASYDPFTGGYLRVSVFDSNGLRDVYSKPTSEVYLSYHKQSDEFHSRTIYIFSIGQIGDAVVTQWFSSGCLIQPVDVMAVHPIGHVRGYIIRRVVLKDKDASTIIEEVRDQCGRYGCRNRTSEKITDFPCLQIVNELFYFAELTKKELSDLLGYSIDD